jgi:hypothetical protein
MGIDRMIHESSNIAVVHRIAQDVYAGSSVDGAEESIRGDRVLHNES